MDIAKMLPIKVGDIVYSVDRDRQHDGTENYFVGVRVISGIRIRNKKTTIEMVSGNNIYEVEDSQVFTNKEDLISLLESDGFTKVCRLCGGIKRADEMRAKNFSICDKCLRLLAEEAARSPEEKEEDIEVVTSSKKK